MKRQLKDKKIEIYTVKMTMDDVGNSIGEWTKLTKSPLWAYFRQIGGNEYYASAVIDRVDEDVVFYINWRDDIDTSARIVYKRKEYEITRIDPYEGYKNDLKLYCKLAPYNEIIKDDSCGQQRNKAVFADEE